MGLVRDHDDVVPVAVGLALLDILVELVNQAEHITMVFLEKLLQHPARAGTRRLVVRHPAADKGLVDLSVQVIAVRHQQESEIARHGAPHFFGKERHRIRLAAALRVPHHAQPAQIGMRSLNNLQGPRFWGRQIGRGRGFCSPWVGRHRLIGRQLNTRHGQLNHAMPEPLTGGKLALERFLPDHCRHRLVHTQQLMVARHHLAHRAGLAGIEQNKILHNVQQPVLGQHAVEQYLCRHISHVFLVQALPLAKVLPSAGDGAKTGVVAVADDQERIVVKRMRDDVLVQVVAQIAIETGPDVLVHRLEFDEHQGQPVHKTHQIGAAVVVGRAQPGELEFAHYQKSVVVRVAKVDHGRLGVAQLPLGVTVTHRHAVADQLVKRLVVLQQ